MKCLREFLKSQARINILASYLESLLSESCSFWVVLFVFWFVCFFFFALLFCMFGLPIGLFEVGAEIKCICFKYILKIRQLKSQFACLLFQIKSLLLKFCEIKSNLLSKINVSSCFLTGKKSRFRWFFCSVFFFSLFLSAKIFIFKLP